MQGPESDPSQSFNPERRFYNDTATWLAEVLDGSMRTPFEYRYLNGELYSSDGSPLGPIFRDSLEAARIRCESDPGFAFELRRRGIELDEYCDMLTMAEGETPNTLVVVSDFPPELMNAMVDKYGYNVQRKQTMLRIITRSADGTILMRSQSLDGSNRAALEAIYAAFSMQPQPGELLGQRIHVELPAEEQDKLADTLTEVYDHTLQGITGVEHYAGRREGRTLNTYDFVLGQSDLLVACKNRIDTALTKSEQESAYYDLAAAMKRRFENFLRSMSQEIASTHETAVNNGVHQNVGTVAVGLTPYQEMRTAGDEARNRGEVMTGCGLTLGADGANGGAGNEMSALGYGNRPDPSDKKGSLIFECPKGHRNMRRHGKTIDYCQVCNTEVGCKPEPDEKTSSAIGTLIKDLFNAEKKAAAPQNSTPDKLGSGEVEAQKQSHRGKLHTQTSVAQPPAQRQKQLTTV